MYVQSISLTTPPVNMPVNIHVHVHTCMHMYMYILCMYMYSEVHIDEVTTNVTMLLQPSNNLFNIIH